MKKLLIGGGLAVFAFALSVNFAFAATLTPFTQTELDTNWEADRTFPTGGVTSVSEFGRDNVAHIGIDSGETASGGFYRTEGIKTKGVDNFGNAVQVDLYIDPAWENNATRAGFWVVGDDGAGARDGLFGIIEFVNSENCDEGNCSGTHITNRPDHEGFRIWDSNVGWTEELNTAFTYGEWVTLGIELDTVTGKYIYYINGEEVGTAAGGVNFIRELFLNSYNYGSDDFPTLNSDSYAARWNAGLLLTNKDQCKKDGWKLFTSPSFKNQGQCVSYVQSNEKAGKRN